MRVRRFDSSAHESSEGGGGLGAAGGGASDHWGSEGCLGTDMLKCSGLPLSPQPPWWPPELKEREEEEEVTDRHVENLLTVASENKYLRHFIIFIYFFFILHIS